MVSEHLDAAMQCASPTLGDFFGGRYKAILVEEGDYLTSPVHYIHLNPVRAGMVKRSDGLESYQWSSLPDYMKPPRKRRP